MSVMQPTVSLLQGVIQEVNRKREELTFFDCNRAMIWESQAAEGGRKQRRWRQKKSKKVLPSPIPFNNNLKSCQHLHLFMDFGSNPASYSFAIIFVCTIQGNIAELSDYMSGAENRVSQILTFVGNAILCYSANPTSHPSATTTTLGLKDNPSYV